MAGLHCAENLIDNCVNEADRDVYHNLTKDMVGVNVALCTPGSPLSISMFIFKFTYDTIHCM